MKQLVSTLLLVTGWWCAAGTCAGMQVAVVSGGKLVPGTIAIPEPGANEIRIKVRAAAFNPVDRGYRRKEGSVPGFDASGVVDGVGAGVTAWKQGDEVITDAPGGSYAQYVVTPVSNVAKKPRLASFEEAAGIPVVGETAYRALTETAKLRPGQRILIHGGAGGVGSAAVQIAKALGAYVIATASARNHDYLKSIGADAVIDYTAVKFEEQVRDLDVVFNTVDADTAVRSLGIMKPDGILVSIVGSTPADQCKAKRVRCMGLDRDQGAPDGELLTRVAELVDAGKYKVNIDARFKLAEAQQAWDVGSQKRTRGKLIIVIPQ